MTPLLEPKPSISVSSWFKVFSRSSLPPMAAAPRASHGIDFIDEYDARRFLFGIWRNRSRTREAPTPTNISTKSEPASEKNGTLASPATAFCQAGFYLFPEAYEQCTLGILPPRSVYFWGCFRNSTISSTSCLVSASPATSLNWVTFTGEFFFKQLALDLPTLKMPLPPPMPPPLLQRRDREYPEADKKCKRQYRQRIAPK